MRSAVILALALSATPVAGAPVRHASERWVVLERPGGCEAMTRALHVRGPDRPQARAGFVFDFPTRRSGRFVARLGAVPRDGSTVMLTIGGKPFLLASRGGWAWSRDDVQSRAILDLVRSEPRFTIRGQATGSRFVDRYEIRGAATAIDSAAACALAKRRRRN